MKTLQVFYEDQKVGTLSKSTDLVYSFSYDDQWRKSENAFPLSLAMPLTQKNFGNRLTLSFFENLLPEGEVRENLERHYQVKEPFDFLRMFGKDCAGAIIVTEQENFDYKATQAAPTLLNMKKVHQALRDHESVADVISDTGYLSLAGAQDKFAAIYKNGKFYLPLQGGPTTHIVKTPIWRSGVKDSVYNEYYCMQLAKAVGLLVPQCEIIEGDHPLFVIERYDRTKEQKQVRRLHQQDFCQALGLTSDSKYESQGGPTLMQNYELIRENVTIKKRAESLNLMMDWVCYNLLIGNNDSHSKNISLLLNQGRIELAPFYDLMCTALYPKLKRNFSFRIGDRDLFHEIGKNQFEELEAQIGLKKGTWLDRLSRLNQKVMTEKDKTLREVLKKYPKSKIVNSISTLIDQRSKSLHLQKAL